MLFIVVVVIVGVVVFEFVFFPLLLVVAPPLVLGRRMLVGVRLDEFDWWCGWRGLLLDRTCTTISEARRRCGDLEVDFDFDAAAEGAAARWWCEWRRRLAYDDEAPSTSSSASADGSCS